MAFLARCKKLDLGRIVEDLGIEITPADRVVDICRKIKTSPDFEEEFAKGQLEVISQEREAQRAYELKKLRNTSATETVRAAGIEEEEWVPQLISFLPLEFAQVIIKEPEEKMRDYVSIKEVLLNRFKMKPETFRLKFTQHQRKSGALWKEMVFELGNYLEGWLDGLDVKDFKSLKDLMTVDQLKRPVSSDI
ncbi:hypothetical protein AVEN_113121-1 [Araneus ventricosus]|uniref:SCAN box domain-containing protein n=1 Tax=Araneus ventricosus TaxID=182803 RepID=A0A4Y2P199_ARAVE|nr:hypothetical protein AVEN_113121-1 [Araneus ventricosus]